MTFYNRPIPEIVPLIERSLLGYFRELSLLSLNPIRLKDFLPALSKERMGHPLPIEILASAAL